MIRLKRIFAAAFMLFSGVSCAESGDTADSNVYSAVGVGLPEDYVPSDVFLSDDGGLFIWGERILEEGGDVLSHSMLVRTDKKFGVIYSGTVETPDGGHVFDCCAYTRGRLLLLSGRYDAELKTRVWGLSLWNDGKSETLCADLSEVISGEMSGGFFPSDMAVDAEGRICLTDGQTVVGLDHDVKRLFAVECEVNIDRLDVSDGNVYAVGYDENTIMTMLRVDLETGAVTEHYKAPSGTECFAGAGYDAYFNDGNAVFSVNIGSEPEKLLDFIESDIVELEITDIAVISSERMILALRSGDQRDIVGADGEVLVMDRLPSDRIPEREILTLAVGASDYTLKSDVVRFNRSNEKYRVRIKEYPRSAVSGAETPDEMLKKDLTSGNAPDMIRSTDFELTSELAISGNLVDLYTLMDGADREKLLSEVVDGFEYNGKLYELPVSLSVRTLAAKKSLVGDDGLSTDGFISVVKSLPQGSYPLINGGRDEILDLLLAGAIGDFVDVDGGKSGFLSDEFREILSFAAEFPDGWRYEESLDADAREDYRSDMDGVYRDGRIAFLEEEMYSLSDAVLTVMRFGGDEVVFTGYPTIYRANPAILGAGESYAVSVSTEHADGAWEFILKTLDSADKAIPVTREAFDKACGKLVGYTFFSSGNGYTGWGAGADEKDIASSKGGADGIERTVTEADMDSFLETLKSAKTENYLYARVMSIIHEEAEMYFEGIKTLDETVKVIQSRVGTYIAEKN